MNKLFCKAALISGLLNLNFTLAQNEITPQWAHIAHATHTDMARDIWVNVQAESYIFGDITSLEEFNDHQGMMLLKLNGQGQEQWRKYVHGATIDWAAEAKSVTGDQQGNVYIVYNEYRDIPFNNQRVVVRKYNAQGQQLWWHYLTPETDNVVEQLVTGALVYKNGFLYATGTSYVTPAMFEEFVTDGFIYKINAATGAAEKYVYDSPQYHGDDTLLESQVDSNGNIYAIGRSKSFNGTGGLFSDYDAVTVKFDAQGNLQWEHRLNGSADDEDFGISLTLDVQDNIYTSNQLTKAGVNEKEVVVQKLNAAGQVVWTSNYQGSDTEDLWRQPLAVLPNGNVALVVSNFSGINTMALNGETGEQLWIQTYNRNNAGFANHHRDMVTDAQGNIIVTGTSQGSESGTGGKDIVTLKYTGDGALAWLSNHDHTNYFTFGDDGVTLGVDGAGNVYTIGWIYQTGANAEFLVLKYGDAVMAANNSVLAEVQVYPNPASEQVFVSVPNEGLIDDITIYDVNGRKIRQWKTRDSLAQLNLGDLVAGLYMLSVTSGSATASYKIIKR